MSGGKHIWIAECELLSLTAEGSTAFLALLALEEKENALLNELADKGKPLPDIPTRSILPVANGGKSHRKEGHS